MARPSKLTREVLERIVMAIRAGNYVEPAVKSAGISPATHYRWIERGSKAKSGIHRDYHDAIKKAEADAEVEAVAHLRKKIPEDWRAAQAYLERRHPERWRRRESRELTGADGGPVRVADAMFEEPEVRKGLREVLKRAGRSRADESGGTRADD